MIYGYLILIIIMLITLTIILWSTYKNNRMYISILLILTIIGNCFVYFGFTTNQGSLNRNAYHMMIQFEDSLLEFNKYKETINSIDKFDALVIEIRDLYRVTKYLESIHKNLTLKNISVEDFGYIVKTLNGWIEDYLEIHKRLYKDDRNRAENYFEAYNRIATLLVGISSHLSNSTSNYYDIFHVLTFELRFKNNSFDELSKINQELNKLLETFD
ncbi:MAG: hypothetical protein LCH34_13355 [Firmicutes bacterium]|nr:hypothetical protein [Bacillota bacterium]